MRPAQTLPGQIAAMAEIAVHALASGDPARQRGLVRDLATRFPGVPALSVGFAITSAASSLEVNIAPGDPGADAAAFAYRIAAILAVDVLALESMGYLPAQARDLMHFWNRVDDYFLRL